MTQFFSTVSKIHIKKKIRVPDSFKHHFFNSWIIIMSRGMDILVWSSETLP